MFHRPCTTYDYEPSLVAKILKDEANPLNRIARLIPNGAKVLDIGAGNGLLADILLSIHSQLIVDGVEPDPYAAQKAKKHYRNFYCGYAQDFLVDINAEDYDFVVLADVIEHMTDPLAFLTELAARLGKKTRIILTVPNIAFGAIRISLLNGSFDYVDSGILERTHLRFFTLETIVQLINKVGINIEKQYFLQCDIFNTEVRVDWYRAGLFTILRILKDDLSSTYQFLFVLTMNEVQKEKKTFGETTKYSLLKYLKMKIHGFCE